jgi:hypothetical protein
MRCVLLLGLTLITGCDQRIDRVFEALTGRETQTVVLAAEPTTVGPDGLVLTSNEPMKVIGDVAGVCLVLKSGTELAPQPVMEKHFQEALHGAKLSATLTLKTGQTFQSSSVAQSWAQHGNVTSSAEIAACISCACGPKPPVGAEISNLVVKSSSPLRVLGIYWESTNAYDQIAKSN